MQAVAAPGLDRRLVFAPTQTSSWPLPAEVASVWKSVPELQAGGCPGPTGMPLCLSENAFVQSAPEPL